jgi:membrane associated rhomboid family serine protease
MFIPLKDDNPTRRFPVVTTLLIAVNIFVFLYQLFSPQGLQYHVFSMGAIPWELTHFQTLPPGFNPWIVQVERLSPPMTLFISMFMHGGFIHLLFNMLYLWIFGNNIEDFLGHFRFFFFYLICGLGASLIHALFNANSDVPMIGASGAIAGVLGAYLILYPNARIKTLVFLIIFIQIVYIPAAFVLGLWFILQVMNVFSGGGVAWFAHIGGFLVGLGLIKMITRKRPRVWIH